MDTHLDQASEDAHREYEYMVPIGYQKGTRCGYCKEKGASFSFFAQATSLSPDFYKTMVDRCWRRSGKFVYRPDLRRSCCPHYTIRLDTRKYRPSRNQRQTVNKFNRFVLGDAYIKTASRLFPRSREETKKRDNQFDVAERVHEAEHSKLRTPPEPAHKFVVTLENDNFTEEKWRVWDNYQAVVHKDPPEDRGKKSFTRFLCNSPLRKYQTTGPDGNKRRFGSYHQCYRIDGKLVAVGVLDLLPDCVSSVYFFYDECLHEHAPGKFGALHEIALAMEEGYRWWYPGFYIHSCPKMKYKIDYGPQEILDPVSLCWDPLDAPVLALLDKKPFVSLSLESDPGSMDSSQMETDEESDEDDAVLRPLFSTGMPGIASGTEMNEVNLDHIALKLFPNGPLLETSDIRDWDTWTLTKWPGLKIAVAELVAALGVDSVNSICLDMARS